MIEIGAILAALFAGISWLIRDVPGIVTAGRTGTIRSKSYGSPVIRREDDLERFDRLVAYRRKRLIWPILMVGGAIAYVALAIVLRSMAVAA